MHTTRSTCTLVLAAALACGPALAQTFQRRSDGMHDEKPWDVERTPDGGFVTAGECWVENEASSFDRQALVVKYDALGVPEWWTHYGDTGDQVACSVDAWGSGYMVACIDATTPGQNLAVLRLDSAGTVVWAKTYEVAIDLQLTDPVRGDPLLPAIRRIANGAFGREFAIVGGDTDDDEGFVMRLREDGNLVVLRHHRVDALDTPSLVYTDVKELSNGDWLVSGSIMRRIDLGYDTAEPILVRMDNIGNPIWEQTYPFIDFGDPTEVAAGLDLSEDEQVCVLTSAMNTDDADVLDTAGWARYINPGDGSLLIQAPWFEFFPALAGVRFLQDGDVLECVSAGHYIDASGYEAPAIGRMTYDRSGTGVLILEFAEAFGLPDLRGRLNATAPPGGGACNWVHAGAGLQGPAQTPYHFLARTDFDGYGPCAPERAGSFNAFPEMQRVAVNVLSFPFPLPDILDWNDGPARAVTITDEALCQSGFCTPTEPQDICVDALGVSSVPFSMQNDNSTMQAFGPPGSCNGGAAVAMQNSQWYWFVAPEGGTYTVEVTEGPVQFDMVTTIFTGNCSSLSEIACADEPEPHALTLDLALGEDVFIAVGDWGATPGGGEYTITINLVPACFADCDGNGSLNVDDIDCFVVGFLGGDLGAADCDGNGVLNVDDIDCFVASFLAGCP